MFFENELSMAYLGFIMSICTVFQPAILLLEKNEGVIVDTYDIMEKVKNSLENRMENKFYGSIARTILSKHDNLPEAARFKTEAENALKICINYLDKWFNFEDNIFKDLRCMQLNNDTIPVFSNLEKLVVQHRIKDIDLDIMFEECFKIKAFVQNNNIKISETNGCDKIWALFFLKFPEAHNLYKLVCFVFSIPHSNASSERIFSLMATTWRKERNRLKIENVEAELMIKQNYQMTCLEFRTYLKSEAGILLLKKVKCSDKY